VDALRFNQHVADERSPIIETLGLKRGSYLLMTVHRPSNTDSKSNMQAIFGALRQSGVPVVFPVHPRTRKYLIEYGVWDEIPDSVLCIEPVGYLDMLRLLSGAEKVLTDSGGVQKEAYISGIPCITLRENTEWVETVQDGWNILVGADEEKIYRAIQSSIPVSRQRDVFGSGDASQRIAGVISNLKGF
jgi:UDP-GlcNAc3NAcA epimerase